MNRDPTAEQRVGYRCLAPGCENVEGTLRAHKRHLRDADHPDHGEVVV